MNEPFTRVAYDHWKTQLFRLLFITVAKLHLRGKNIVMVVVTTRRTVLKGCTLREIENHCPIRTYFPPTDVLTMEC